MGELIEDLMRTKVHLRPTAASKNSILRSVQHSLVFPFLLYNWSLVFLKFSLDFSLQVGAVRTRPDTKVKVHTWINLFFAEMCPRTYVCRASWPHRRMFLNRTNVLPHNLRYSLPSQTPTCMTTVFLSLYTPMILMCLEQFTTGHTLRNSTSPKTSLALSPKVSHPSIPS